MRRLCCGVRRGVEVGNDVGERGVGDGWWELGVMTAVAHRV